MKGTIVHNIPYFTIDHNVQLDHALHNALAMLHTPGNLCAARGLLLALNGHVTHAAGYIAHVCSDRDAEVVYHVHALEGCDCPDVTRVPDGRCWHWWGATLVAMAHIELAAKKYVPEPVRLLYLAISLDAETHGLPILAEQQKDGTWWAQTLSGESGWYTDTLRLVTPIHQLQWNRTVHEWESWLDAH